MLAVTVTVDTPADCELHDSVAVPVEEVEFRLMVVGAKEQERPVLEDVVKERL